MSKGWLGVDLDGTLARYDEWRGEDHIGAPIPAMVRRVKRWLQDGKEVRIFTARVSTANRDMLQRNKTIRLIKDWCILHIGQELEVTSDKDYGMIELYDDRAVQVEKNTGKLIGYSTRGNV